MKFFDGKGPNRSVNPNRAVTFDAAVPAAIFTGTFSSQVQNLIVREVTPLSNWLQTTDGVMKA